MNERPSFATNSSPRLWERIVAENGTFIKTKRDVFEVCLKESDEMSRSAEWVQPYFRLLTPIKVPESILNQILLLSRLAAPYEILFYLQFADGRWNLNIPKQVATPNSVTPLGSPFESGAASAAIEIHSHVNGEARFSATDDADETGLRLYAVIGKINSDPALRLRVGIYGRTFCELPAAIVFELPKTVRERGIPTDPIKSKDKSNRRENEIYFYDAFCGCRVNGLCDRIDGR